MWKKRKIFDEFDRLFEEFEGAPGVAKYFGYSAHIGPDGIPHVKTFGNVEGLEEGPSSWPEIAPEREGVREPYADVLIDDERGELIVTAEMPGIEKKDVALKSTGSEIEIKAEAKDRKYYKKMPLKAEIDPEKIHATYNNGILEIKAPLKGPGNSKGHDIKVD